MRGGRRSDPRGTIESVSGVALISRDPDTGAFDYDGETDIFWDGQETDLDAEGRVTLLCPEGHEWQSKVEG